MAESHIICNLKITSVPGHELFWSGLWCGYTAPVTRTNMKFYTSFSDWLVLTSYKFSSKQSWESSVVSYSLCNWRLISRQSSITNRRIQLIIFYKIQHLLVNIQLPLYIQHSPVVNGFHQPHAFIQIQGHADIYRYSFFLNLMTF